MPVGRSLAPTAGSAASGRAEPSVQGERAGRQCPRGAVRARRPEDPGAFQRWSVPRPQISTGLLGLLREKRARLTISGSRALRLSQSAWTGITSDGGRSSAIGAAVREWMSNVGKRERRDLLHSPALRAAVGGVEDLHRPGAEIRG